MGKAAYNFNNTLPKEGQIGIYRTLKRYSKVFQIEPPIYRHSARTKNL